MVSVLSSAGPVERLEHPAGLAPTTKPAVGPSEPSATQSLGMTTYAQVDRSCGSDVWLRSAMNCSPYE